MPTPAAIRAAKMISDWEEKQYGPIAIGFPGPGKLSEMARIAELIDEATGLPELLKALRNVRKVLPVAGDWDSTSETVVVEFEGDEWDELRDATNALDEILAEHGDTQTGGSA